MLALEPRMFAWRVTVFVHCVLRRAARAQMCRASVCSVFTSRRLSGNLSPSKPKLVLNSEKTRIVRP